MRTLLFTILLGAGTAWAQNPTVDTVTAGDLSASLAQLVDQGLLPGRDCKHWKVSDRFKMIHIQVDFKGKTHAVLVGGPIDVLVYSQKGVEIIDQAWQDSTDSRSRIRIESHNDQIQLLELTNEALTRVNKGTKLRPKWVKEFQAVRKTTCRR